LDACNGGKSSKERIMLLFASSAVGTDIVTPLFIGRVENPCCFKNIRKLPTKYVAIRKAFVTYIILLI
jgi:hypothetical protein